MIGYASSQAEENLDLPLEQDSSLVLQRDSNFYYLTKMSKESQVYVFKHRNLDYGSQYQMTIVQNEIDLGEFVPKGFTLDRADQ